MIYVTIWGLVTVFVSAIPMYLYYADKKMYDEYYTGINGTVLHILSWWIMLAWLAFIYLGGKL